MCRSPENGRSNRFCPSETRLKRQLVWRMLLHSFCILSKCLRTQLFDVFSLRVLTLSHHSNDITVMLFFRTTCSRFDSNPQRSRFDLDKKNSLCFDSGMPSTTSNNSDSAVSQALSVSDADGHLVQGFYDRSDGEQLVYGRPTSSAMKKTHLPEIQQCIFTPVRPANRLTSSHFVGRRKWLLHSYTSSSSKEISLRSCCLTLCVSLLFCIHLCMSFFSYSPWICFLRVLFPLMICSLKSPPFVFLSFFDIK